MSDPLCTWTEDEEGNWDTACGEMHTFAWDGPIENKHRFCPYCGKPLLEKARQEEDSR